MTITLQSPATNATLYYTLDGSIPTTNSTAYAGPIRLLNSVTLSANAWATGYNDSVAASSVFTVQPLYFTSQTWLPNGQFQLGFAGSAGSNYVLQATTNFIMWTPVSTNLALTNMLNLLDPNASNYPYRFYRVQQP